MIYMPIALALLGLVYMIVKQKWVMKQDAGDGKMKEISDHIYEGALAFLNAEYRLLAIFVVIVSILLAIVSFLVPTTHWLIVVAFIFGAIFSAFAGNIGMKIATKTNVRTTQAARTSLPNALKISFGGGTVMGLGVAGLAVLGLTLFFIFFFWFFMGSEWTNTMDMTIVLETLAGFSLGAESIALFARVGGGIYTKAADVGADLVGKVEAGIPEDDPRNPATIADNVGDNVGDVAGMGADLFGSYVATVLAAMVLGNYVIKDMGGSISDAFRRNWTHLITNGNCRCRNYHFYHRYYVGKNQRQFRKRSTSNGCFKYWKLDFYTFSCCSLLWINHIYVTRTNIYGFLWRKFRCSWRRNSKNNFKNQCILCNSSWSSGWCCHLFCN